MHYPKSALVALVLIFVGCLAEQKSANQVGQNTHPVWSPDGDKIAFVSKIGFYLAALEARSSDLCLRAIC